jgi:light-regulated signal transduction histidine kinase (bacteriophytochrome)
MRVRGRNGAVLLEVLLRSKNVLFTSQFANWILTVLYICKGIIEAHGGRIWAKNNNEEKGEYGATFSFSLPLVMSDLEVKK